MEDATGIAVTKSGRRIAVIQELGPSAHLVLIDADGRVINRVALPPPASDPVFIADDRLIAYVGGYEDHSELWCSDLNLRHRRRVKGVRGTDLIDVVAWPQGDKMAVLRSSGQVRLYKVSRTGRASLLRTFNSPEKAGVFGP